MKLNKLLRIKSNIMVDYTKERSLNLKILEIINIVKKFKGVLINYLKIVEIS